MWLIDWDIHKICLYHFDLKEENYTVTLSLMLFVFPVSDIYPSARGKNKMETFQALARTPTRSQSWLGIKWLGRTHWWIWHGGTCAYFLLCVTVIFIVNSVIIIIIIIIVVIVLVIIKLYNMSFWIMCIKGICSWFLIDTLDQHLSRHPDRYSVNNWLASHWTVSQELSHTNLSVDRYVQVDQHSANYRPTVDWVYISVDWDVDQVLI